MTLGEHIATLRKRKKLSQADLGKAIGTSGDIIGRYERDEVKPSIEVASKIADALAVSIDFLVGKTDLELDQEVINRILQIQKLPQKEKECILFNLDAVLRDAKARQTYAS